MNRWLQLLQFYQLKRKRGCQGKLLENLTVSQIAGMLDENEKQAASRFSSVLYSTWFFLVSSTNFLEKKIGMSSVWWYIVWTCSEALMKDNKKYVVSDMLYWVEYLSGAIELKS